MIWLASFPRSGNTFFRIVLDEVYGLESSEFPLGPNKQKIPGYDYRRFPVVKTHLPPNQIERQDLAIPTVYLVRDGRDSLISAAYYQLNFIEQGTDFYNNLKASILVKNDSLGWSKHVHAWLKQADILIKFEELIANPIENVEKLRKIMDLPDPKIENLPTFSDLRSRKMKYGNLGERRGKEAQETHRKKFFRKGKAGTWKEEMPDDLHELFWIHHGTAMDKLGYTEGKIEVPFLKSSISRTINNLRP